MGKEWEGSNKLLLSKSYIYQKCFLNMFGKEATCCCTFWGKLRIWNVCLSAKRLSSLDPLTQVSNITGFRKGNWGLYIQEPHPLQIFPFCILAYINTLPTPPAAKLYNYWPQKIYRHPRMHSCFIPSNLDDKVRALGEE